MEEFWTILLIYALCTVKIIFGPTMGYAAGLSPLLTVIITVAGMMTTIVLFSFIGEWARKTILKRYVKPKRYSPGGTEDLSKFGARMAKWGFLF